MKIYKAPEGHNPPSLSVYMDEGAQAYAEAETKYVAGIVKVCKEHSKHKMAGKIVKFGVADGYAEYAVITPTKLIHLEHGDAYQQPYIDRLKGSDITDQIKTQEKFDALFKKKA